MSPDPTKIFGFLSSSALLSQGTGVAPASPKKVQAEENDLCDLIPSLRITKSQEQETFDASAHSVPSLAPCSVISCNEDDASLCLSQTASPPSAEKPELRRRLKSILKRTSSYGPEAAAAAKNPKSLRRGFQSMMELPTLLPEESACEAPVVDTVPPDLLREDSQDPPDGGVVDGQRRCNGPTLVRKASFSSEGPLLRRIESREDIEPDEKSDLWFQKDEITEFVGAELTRRNRMGIASRRALCSAAEEDERVALRRRASANMPRGVRR